MKKLAIIALAALLMAPVASRAEQKPPVEITQTAEVEVAKKDAQGVTHLTRVEASKANVAPGDTVIYTVSIANNGELPATGLAVTNPVPEHMIYVDGSAQGAGARIEFSVDGGKSYLPQNQLKVTSASGLERTAQAADITNIRWVLEKPLEKGSTRSVSFRARVK